MAIDTDRLRLATIVRDRRLATGYTQADLVERFSELGYGISRSHYAGMEMGRYSFADDQLRVLHALLNLTPRAENLLRDLASHEAETPLTLWKRLARDLAGGENDLPDSTPQQVFNVAIAERATQTVTDPEQINAQVVRAFLAAEAAGRHTPTGAPEVHIIGFPGLHGPDHGMPVATRQALVGALHAGSRCIHTISARSDTSRGTLFRYVASLLACDQYDARLTDAENTGPLDLIVIEPSGDFDGTAIQFLDSTTAIVNHDRASVDAFARLARSIADRETSPLVAFIGFADRTKGDPSLGDAEFNFYRELTARAHDGEWRAYSVGWLPNALIPPAVYSSMIERRRAAANGSYERFEAMVSAQLARRQALMAAIFNGVPVQVLLSANHLRSFAEHGTPYETSGAADDTGPWHHLSQDEVAATLEAIEELRRLHPNLEIRVSDAEKVERGLLNSKWEIRGGKAGFVALQTPAHDGVDLHHHSANMIIDAPVMVAGFKALFDDQWLSSEGEDLWIAAIHTARQGVGVSRTERVVTT